MITSDMQDIIDNDQFLRPVYVDKYGSTRKDVEAIYTDKIENGVKASDSYRGMIHLIRLVTKEIFWTEMGIPSNPTSKQIDEFFKLATPEQKNICIEWGKCMFSGELLDLMTWYIKERSDEELKNEWPGLIPFPIDNDKAISLVIVVVIGIASCTHFLKAPYAEQWKLLCGRNTADLFTKIHQGEVKLSLKLKDEYPSLCLTLRKYEMDEVFGQKKLKVELQALEDATSEEEKMITGPGSYKEKYEAICRKYRGEKRRIEHDGRQISRMYKEYCSAHDVLICKVFKE